MRRVSTCVRSLIESVDFASQTIRPQCRPESADWRHRHIGRTGEEQPGAATLDCAPHDNIWRLGSGSCLPWPVRSDVLHVARRTSELGIRLALGSTRSMVLWVVLRESLIVIGAGYLLERVCPCRSASCQQHALWLKSLRPFDIGICRGAAVISISRFGPAAGVASRACGSDRSFADRIARPCKLVISLKRE